MSETPTVSEINRRFWEKATPKMREALKDYFQFPTKQDLLMKIKNAEKTIADTKEMLKYYE